MTSHITSIDLKSVTNINHAARKLKLKTKNKFKQNILQFETIHNNENLNKKNSIHNMRKNLKLNIEEPEKKIILNETNNNNNKTYDKDSIKDKTINIISNEISEWNDGPMDLASTTKKMKKIGRGAGGIVYLSYYKPLSRLLAIKEIEIHDEQERQMIKNELHALHENLVPLSSPEKKKKESNHLKWLFNHHMNIGSIHPCEYIVSFYGAYSLPYESSVSIAMEYMNAGCLQGYMDTGGVQSEVILRHIAFCIFKALQHIHQNKMIHRDIKPANILFNTNGEYKLADFGLATTLSKSKSFFSDFKGTVMYMAPERITGNNYSFSSDIWSVGIVLISLALGHFPFDISDGFFGLEESIVHEPVPPLPLYFSKQFRTFINSLLDHEPKNRLTATQALNEHPFLSNYHGEDKKINAEYCATWQKINLKRQLKEQDICEIIQHIIKDDKINENENEKLNGLEIEINDLLNKSKKITHSSPNKKHVDKNNIFKWFTHEIKNVKDENILNTKESIKNLANDFGIPEEEIQILFENICK